MNATWLILASASPRRLALLRSTGLEPRVVIADVDESRRADESPISLARRLAHTKASCGWVRAAADAPCIWSVGADTVVHRDGRVFEKPVDAVDAAAILHALSGDWHSVTTGFCVQRIAQGRVDTHQSGHVTTRVRFRALTRKEIAAYVKTGEPLDKAGAYGIQGLGGALVAEVQGSYTNVVGLPLDAVLATLSELEAPVADRA